MADSLLTTAQAAQRLGLARGTLAKMRIAGNGPPFRKLGARVLYPVVELETWLESQPLFRSTAQVSAHQRKPSPAEAA